MTPVSSSCVGTGTTAKALLSASVVYVSVVAEILKVGDKRT